MSAKVGDIFLLMLRLDLYGAVRILGRAGAMDTSGLTKYALEDLRKRGPDDLLMMLSAWSGEEPPPHDHPRLVEPLYIVSSGFVEDYYKPWICWMTPEYYTHPLKEMSKLIVNVPLTAYERKIGIMRTWSTWDGMADSARKQIGAQMKASPESLKNASEVELQTAAENGWKHGTSLGSELDGAVGDLVRLGLEADFRHERTRAIGERLFALGGRSYMLAVWWRVYYSHKELSTQSLSNMWHGIGGWTS